MAALALSAFCPAPFPLPIAAGGLDELSIATVKTELDEIGSHFSLSQIRYSNLPWRSPPSTGNYEKLPVR